MQQEHVITSLTKLRACRESLTWAQRYPDSKVAWEACERSDWMLWLLRELRAEPRLLVRIAVACAKRALKGVPAGEERPANAISLVERGLAGETVTNQELTAAADAAYAAADAAYAAADAARSAADAAYAAADAARSAADAAYAARSAAADAAYAAADAALYAAGAAALYAAGAAADAYAALYAAERREQCAIIRAIVSYDTVAELLDARFAL